MLPGRAAQHSRRLLSLLRSRRCIHIFRPLARDPLFRPSPPPLPAAEQREFEELLKKAARPAAAAAASSDAPELREGEELHPDARRRPVPEFQGDVNPRTGEVGGPKREPVRHNDWSYGGRATDF